MHIIGLFLCLLFGAWLVIRDCRRRRNLSTALWLPTLMLLVLASRPVSLWLSGTHQDVVEMGNEASGNLIDQLFYVFMLGSSFAVAVNRRTKWGKLFSANMMITVLYLYFALSVCWSGDPSGSVKRLVKDFGLIFTVAVIYSEEEPLQAIRAVYMRCAAVLLPLSVVLIKWFPAYSREYARNGDISVTGVTMQKNTLGEIIMLFIMFLIWDYVELRPPGVRSWWRRPSWDHVVLIAAGAWLLRLSHSKTALLCLLVGAAIFLRGAAFRSKAVNRTILFVALSLPILLFFSGEFHSVIAPLIGVLGRSMTFTGRADIWAHIDLKTVDPIIGAGYWNFWGGPGGAAIMREMTTIIPNAHNGYLDMYLDGGFIGITILFFVLLCSGLHIMGQFRGPYGRFARLRFAVLIVVIIYNLSESTYARLGTSWFTALVVMLDFPVLSVAKTAQNALMQRKSSMLQQRPAELLNH